MPLRTLKGLLVAVIISYVHSPPWSDFSVSDGE